MGLIPVLFEWVQVNMPMLKKKNLSQLLFFLLGREGADISVFIRSAQEYLFEGIHS